MKTRVVKAPEKYANGQAFMSVFLAGSIEMGKAIDWQTEVEQSFKGRYDDVLDGREIALYNPRRDDWDSTWVQSIDNDNFREQVEWEHEYLMIADIPIFYFDPDTMSPITLMELGMVAQSGFLTREPIVCCPDGFWRKGNVDILCANNGIKRVKTLNQLIEGLHFTIQREIDYAVQK